MKAVDPVALPALATVAWAVALFAVAVICFYGGRQLGREEASIEFDEWREQWQADHRRHGIRPLRARRDRLYDFETEPDQSMQRRT